MINELMTKMVEIAIKSIPNQTFELMIIRIKILITYSEVKSNYFLQNERKSYTPRIISDDGKKVYIEDFAWQLREAIYNLAPEKGAWYSMEMIVFPNGKFNFDFEYEIKPEFLIPLSDLDFIKDFQKFPRQKEYIPEWLIEILERNQII